MVRFDLSTAREIRFGPGRVTEVPTALAEQGVTRALVVTGSRPERADPLRAALTEAGVASEVFAVSGEPSVAVARAATATATGSAAQAVVGLGGGSALDVAKAAAALAGSGTDPLDHLEVVGAGRPLGGSPLRCVAVPTTAGTGSEVTRNAVLGAEGVKASLRGPTLLPWLAVVDPDLLVGVPRATVVATGMDAFSQLVEPFLSGRANPVTDAWAREGLSRSARSLERAGREGLDDDAGLREDLALASLLGGLCLANAGLGAVHGFAAGAGARLVAPHGAVCAALLAATLETNLAALRSRAPDHPALGKLAELATILTGRPDTAPEDAVAWVRRLVEALEVPGLGGYGVADDVVGELAAAARRSNSMRGNPIELTDEELTGILRRSW